MNDEKKTKRWEGTNVTNLWKLATSGGYYARVKVNGKEKWRSLKTKVFSVAKLRLADFERKERAKGERSADAAVQVEGGRCGKLLEIILADVRLSTSTKEPSKYRFETAAKALGKTWPDFSTTDVRQITPLRCKQWARHAQTEGTRFTPPQAKPRKTPKGMSPSSFNQTLSVLRNVFSLAIKLGLIYSDPSEDIKRMTPTKKRLTLPSIGEFERIVSRIANSHGHHSKDCADMVRLLAYSGMRLREATSLTWGRIDFDKDVIHVADVGTGTLKTEHSARTIPLFPDLKTHLQGMMEKAKAKSAEAGEEFSVESRVLPIAECQIALTNACAKAGAKRMTHHDLRHLFATRCIESGVDIPTVSRWMGHADGGALAMRTYGHLRQEHSQAQAAKVTWKSG